MHDYGMEQVRLQWGRDLLIAEIKAASAARCARNALQWGRDLLIAEIIRQEPGASHAVWLQWGRDLLIAEIDHPSAAPVQLFCASMGPRSADRGNKCDERHGDGGIAGFNGAAIC